MKNFVIEGKINVSFAGKKADNNCDKGYIITKMATVKNIFSIFFTKSLKGTFILSEMML
ncbi:MAG: hypothetical protein IJB74_09455 [Clostridia bacterium]|nr:hypothetical protein [Clostridia bacterium]